jgi:hypothetical protein
MGHYAKIDSYPFQPKCFKLLLSLSLSFDVRGPYFDIYMSKGTTLSYDVAHRTVRS